MYSQDSYAESTILHWMDDYEKALFIMSHGVYLCIVEYHSNLTHKTVE